MRTSFPVEFDAFLLGKSREAGSFESDDGTVTYGDAYDLKFESAAGLTQVVRVSINHLDQAADFDVNKLPLFAPLHVVGDVSIGDGRGSFRAVQVRQVGATAKAA